MGVFWGERSLLNYILKKRNASFCQERETEELLFCWGNGRVRMAHERRRSGHSDFPLPSPLLTHWETEMNNLPTEIVQCIFHHLDAFDAHRFGLTHQRAFRVILSERKRVPQGSLYDRWFGEVEERVEVLMKKWLKVYAENPDSEYAPSLQQKIQSCTSIYWGDELWELITGQHYNGVDMDLEDFAIQMVDGYESCTITALSGLHRCTVCDLLNVEDCMSWEGASWGTRIFDQHSYRKCIECKSD